MHLYYFNINELRNHENEYMKMLSDERRLKLNTYKLQDDKLRCIAGGILITRFVCGGDVSKLKVKNNKYGKPYCSNTKYFNISHSKDYVILLIDNKRVGCDIQYKNSVCNYNGVMRHLFYPDEIEYVNCHNTKDSFYQIWSLKESLGKAKGTGLYGKNENFFECLSYDCSSKPRCFRIKQWNFWEYYTKEYSVALCGENDFTSLEIEPFYLG
jgi:4'-phosphopantetheinyl transferase